MTTGHHSFKSKQTRQGFSTTPAASQQALPAAPAWAHTRADVFYVAPDAGLFQMQPRFSWRRHVSLLIIHSPYGRAKEEEQVQHRPHVAAEGEVRSRGWGRRRGDPRPRGAAEVFDE